MLKPGIESIAAQRLELIGANVHRADDARVAIEVGGSLDKGIVAGIDAR